LFCENGLVPNEARKREKKLEYVTDGTEPVSHAHITISVET